MRTLPLLALAVLFAAPAAGQVTPGLHNPPGPSPVTLYFHLADFQDFPINTQKPAKDFTADTGAGITTSSTSCLPTTAAGTGQSFHTLHGFSSPGYVEYQYIESNRPRFHPERGLSYDVHLAGDTLTMHWYLATQTGLPGAGGQDPNTAPLLVPQVVVKATLRTGENIQIDGGGYDDGQLIAQGQSEPALLAGPASPELSPQLNWTVVGGQNVYDVTVPLHVSQAVIPKAGGFSLRVDTFVSMPGPCADPSSGYVMPNLVTVHSSDGYRPRLLVNVMEPVRIEYMHPQFVGDLLYVHTSANSPFGNYDVDVYNGTILTIAGPTPAASLTRGAVVQRTHEHGSHTQAVDVTYIWNFAKDAAAIGTYSVALEVSNDQHTAVAQGTSSFTLGAQLQVTRCGGLNETELAAAQGGCSTEYQDAQGNPVTPSAKSPNLQVPGTALVLAIAAIVARRR